MPERYHIVVPTDSNQKYLHSAPNHNKDEIAIATKTPADFYATRVTAIL